MPFQPTGAAVTIGSSIMLAVLASGCAATRRAETANAGPPRERVTAAQEVAGAQVADVRFTGEVTPLEERSVLSDSQRIIGDSLAAARRMDGSSDALAFRDYLDRAHGVFVFPAVKRDALAVGAPGSGGVLFVRRPDGSLSNPLFYSLGPGSTGVALDFEWADIVLFLMNDASVDAALGGGLDSASLATGSLLAEGHQGTVGSAADVISLVESDGQLYAGPSFAGTVIRPMPSLNADFYGPQSDARTVAAGERTANPSAALLVDSLRGMAAPWTADSP